MMFLLMLGLILSKRGRVKVTQTLLQNVRGRLVLDEMLYGQLKMTRSLLLLITRMGRVGRAFTNACLTKRASKFRATVNT